MVIGVLSVAACDDSGGEEAQPTTTTTTEVVQTTTTAAAPNTTSTTQAVLSQEDQLRRTTVEIMVKGDELYLAPDPARVAEVYDPDCPCFQAFQEDLTALQARGLRTTELAVEVLGVRLEDQTIPTLPTLTVIYQRSERVFVDASGVTVERRPSLPPTALSLQLALADGRFVVTGLQVLDDIGPDALQAVIAEGVP